jgi:hypothetical protein
MDFYRAINRHYYYGDVAMNHFRILIAAAFAGFVAFGSMLAQAQQATPAPRSAPAQVAPTPQPPSTAAKVETWTKEQWAAARKEWSKDKAKWADCRKQSNDQKLSGRKSWSFLYNCMASKR